MNETKVEKAKEEAQRFLEAVQQMQTRMDEDPYALYGSRQSGQLKRRSLDLTRALADLRKS